jgi:hypothetical protein
MNQRIFELAKTSGAWDYFNDGDKSAIMDQQALQNFAMAVVKECMLICGAVQGAGEIRNMHEFASGAAQCKVIIKRDFGVGE